MVKSNKLNPKDYIGKEVFALVGVGDDSIVYEGTVRKYPFGCQLETEDLQYIYLESENVEIFLDEEEALKASGLMDVHARDIIGKQITIDTGSAAILSNPVLEDDSDCFYVEYGGKKMYIEHGKHAKLCSGKVFDVEFGELKFIGKKIRINTK